MPEAVPERTPPTVLVLGAVTSVQFGAALAKTLFDEVGPGGAVLLRVSLAALVLVLLWRPSLRGHTRREWLLIAAFGACLAGMNTFIYEALDRIPLGVAVTLEFVGPLGVAVVGSRRALDLLWVLLAAAGIVLLSDVLGGGGRGLDGVGVAFALLAGGFWAAYIVLTARVGAAFAGGGALALAMVVATLPVLPLGVAEGGADLVAPGVLAVALGVAVLSSALPYSLELEALRRMPSNVFGVLMSLEPGAAAIAGLLVLGQGLHAYEVVAIALVVVASAGAAATAGPAHEPRDPV